MFSERLNLALETGALTLPASGTIAVIGARAGDDLDPLPADRVQVVARLYPDNAAFRNSGYAVSTKVEGPYSAAIVCLPRSKAEARLLIRDARAATSGPVAIDGQKTDGVDSILKEVRQRADIGEVLSKAHGKFFSFDGGDFADWEVGSPSLVEGRFRTSPGVFSADRVDPGSRELAAALPKVMKGHVVDLGAGWGYLADAILTRDGVTSLDLVEADHVALEDARHNITDPRARFHWADARTFRPDTSANHVVMNPPFHESRAADPELGRAFIRAAAAMLTPKGQLWLVANRHLPYETTLQDAFRDVKILGQTPSFKLYAASHPRPPRKG